MFQRQEIVRFQHCDPAGIVFYPRYVEMINATVEDWFAYSGIDFAQIHVEEKVAIPAVSISVNFRAASRLGEMLTFTLRVLRIGTTSVGLSIDATHDDELRFESQLTLVFISQEDYRPKPWPENLRSMLENGLPT
jgi:4-hydroxybenzoyl-CoA thioesterase